MDELVATAGGDEIEVALSWAAVTPALTAAEATRGRLRLSLRGKPIWYGADPSVGFEWSWIELLEYLGESWLYLAVEDGAPLGVGLDTAPRMRAAAEVALERSELFASDIEREQLEAFQLTHDLAEAIQGAALPAVWVVREGLVGWVATAHVTATATFAEVLTLLEDVGNFIAARLDTREDQRSQQALATWAQRNIYSRLDLIEAATGFPPALVTEVESAFLSDTDRSWDSPESDVLLAAARMIGPQNPGALRPILETMKKIKRAQTPALDLLTDRATKLASEIADDRPHEQGYQLATWLRNEPNIIDADGRVDPEGILKSWGVEILQVPLKLTNVDAIGCWGPENGPAVLVNQDASFGNNPARLHATLAHEIIHLLVDRASSLPLAEVLGGRTAENVEKRARAFAAELLLPRSVAADVFLSYQGDDQAAIEVIRKKFGVSAELLAWQVKNSGRDVPPESLARLSELVSRPSRFGPY